MSDQLRNKIQQWEASPPPTAWSNIAAAVLDVHAENRLASRLAQHEETPPPEIWMAVRNEIQANSKQEATPAPVIPMKPLYPYLFRYGAVAMLAGFIAWLFIGNPFWDKTVQESATNTNTIPATEIPANGPGNPDIVTAITGNPANITQPVPMENIPLSNDLPARDPQYAIVQPVKKTVSETVIVNRLPALRHSPSLHMQELPVQKRNQRYITIYSATGEPIRLSAKFAPLYYALENGTENNGPQVVQGFLQKMQQQMTRRPYIPDPNNHFDMIRLVDLLQQEQ